MKEKIQKVFLLKNLRKNLGGKVWFSADIAKVQKSTLQKILIYIISETLFKIQNFKAKNNLTTDRIVLKMHFFF